MGLIDFFLYYHPIIMAVFTITLMGLGMLGGCLFIYVVFLGLFGDR